MPHFPRGSKFQSSRVLLCITFNSPCHYSSIITKQDPEKAIIEWVEKMFSDRRSSTSAAPDLTPLHMAIYKQHSEVARLLIEKGANVKKKDHFGLTPFMLCALRSKCLILLFNSKKMNKLINKF